MKYCFLILFVLLFNLSHGQEMVPVQSWRYHFSYQSALDVTGDPSNIFAAAENGIVRQNLIDNSLETITKKEGLNDAGIGAIFLHQDQKLIVGYTNGNIDVLELESGIVRNIDALKNSESSTPKAIHEIKSFGSVVMLASDAGILEIDLEQYTLKELYQNLGIGGEHLNVFSLTTHNDSIFAGTNKGVMAASNNGQTNLHDFNNWHKYSVDGFPADPSIALTTHHLGVVAGVVGSGVYVYDGNWAVDGSLPVSDYYNLESTGNDLLVTTTDKVWIKNNSGVNPLLSDFIAAPSKTILMQGVYWIADFENGLIQNKNGQETVVQPNGPASNQIKNIRFSNQIISAFPTGLDDTGNPGLENAAFSRFIAGKWVNYGNKSTYDIPTPAFVGANDLSESSSELLVATTENGLLRLEGDNWDFIDDSTPGSPLKKIDGIGPQIAFIQAYDGGFFVSNYGASPSLYYYKSGNWTPYFFSFTNSEFIWKLKVTSSNELWALIHPAKGGGIIVSNMEGTQSRKLTSSIGNGGLPSTQVNAIDEDRDGLIWCGTEKGIAYLNLYPSVLDGFSVDATVPLFDGRPLLKDKIINSVVVDGGDRKWIASDDGIRLLNATVDEEIHFFNSSNSPMIEDNVQSIQIDPNSGEVFLLSNLGLVSYTSDAQTPSEALSNLKIFPNPVLPDYKGVVTIDNLAFNSDVKIVDSAGRLLWQGRSNGGRVAWNLLDLNGRRAGTGVCFVLVADEAGKEAVAGKILLIN